MASSQAIPRSNVLANIRTYAAQVATHSVEPPSTTDLAAAEVRLDQTVAELQARIDRQRATLDELRHEAANRPPPRPDGRTSPLAAASGPAPDAPTRLRQMRAVTVAYKRLADSEPELPGTHSSLPALLAIDALLRDNAAVQEHVQTTYHELRAARRRWTAAIADEADHVELADALQARIQALRRVSPSAPQTAEAAARARLAAANARRRTADAAARQCTRALVRFIDSRLAPLLAAEELGGPVAGTVPGLTENDVLAGFTAHGRVKRPRARNGDGPASDQAVERNSELRQQRIDAIWGLTAAFAAEEVAPRSEVEAAATEMRELVQALLDASTTPGSGAPYVRLARDSAAARFLVRSNVAVLHRTEARRIRLQDFGRDVDE